MTPPWKCFGRRCVGFCVVLYSFRTLAVQGSERSLCRVQCKVLCIVCVQFEAQTIHFATRGKSAECRVKCRVCVQFVQFFCFPFYLCIVVVCARTQHGLQERANRRKLHSPHRADATFCFGSLAFCLRPGFRLLNLMLLYFVSQCVLLSVSSVTQFAMLLP